MQVPTLHEHQTLDLDMTKVEESCDPVCVWLSQTPPSSHSSSSVQPPALCISYFTPAVGPHPERQIWRRIHGLTAGSDVRQHTGVHHFCKHSRRTQLPWPAAGDPVKHHRSCMPLMDVHQVTHDCTAVTYEPAARHCSLMCLARMDMT